MDRIRVRDLTDIDAFAMRLDECELVHISSSVPAWAQPAVADHLLDALRTAPGRYAAITLYLGCAVRVAHSARARAAKCARPAQACPDRNRSAPLDAQPPAPATP